MAADRSEKPAAKHSAARNYLADEGFLFTSMNAPHLQRIAGTKADRITNVDGPKTVIQISLLPILQSVTFAAHFFL